MLDGKKSVILTKEQAEERLNSSANLANRFGFSASQKVEVRTIHAPGRKTNIPNLDPVIRNQIAFRARLGEAQATLAEEFGTTQARVSQLENGKDKSLNEEAIKNGIAEIRDTAVDKLMESLNLIDRPKLQKEGAAGLARIASSLAKVVEATSDKGKSETNIQVVVYSPEQRKEASFKIIDA